MKLSITTTLYKSSPFVRDFHRRAAAAASAITPDFEIIFVDDGSPDDSAQIVRALIVEQPRISTKLIELSRNFGHHPALMTGLEHATGDLVFMTDVDLEEPPELLLKFVEKMKSQSATGPIDVVYGVQDVQDGRKGGFIENLGGAIFYAAFNLLSGVRIPENILTTRLMSRAYVKAVAAHQERELFLAGVLSLAGFRQVPLPASKAKRETTSYTARKRISLALNAIISFSDRPLVGIFIIGAAISFAAFLGILYVLSRVLVFGITYLAGWPSLIVTIWFFCGIMLLAIGILGLYLARVFVEVKQRPRVIREITSNYEKT